ncbi:hypothetical protein [Streptomyces sp. B1I3]|uniref:hypothetical protein n=1 Tax=Streptomyces sp. B1I3 TaxID=3042264 RepID=UPI00278B9B3B|nr:hypothetical protein [Streptomyces sp. B1I3]MDQ0791689.1 hypothetical protein [Streptomyces sp. B1I3]
MAGRHGRRVHEVEVRADALGTVFRLDDPYPLRVELHVGRLDHVQFLGRAVVHREQQQNPERVQIDFLREQQPVQHPHQAGEAAVAGVLSHEVAQRLRPALRVCGQVLPQDVHPGQTVPSSPHQVRQFPPNPPHVDRLQP